MNTRQQDCIQLLSTFCLISTNSCSSVIFGLAAQFFGPGVVAPLYFFLHYVNTPLNRMRIPRMRKINPQFARKIFLTLALFSYLPVLLMFLGPSPSIRHAWAWVWQMFPLWVSVGQWIRTRMYVEESTLSIKIKPRLPNTTATSSELRY